MSPLQRTLETAVGVFGGGPGRDGDESCLLMRGQSDAPHECTAHDSVVLPAHGPPFVACEQCRERVGAAQFLLLRVTVLPQSKVSDLALHRVCLTRSRGEKYVDQT